MSRIVDLSHAIYHGLPVFPNDPAVGFLTHHLYDKVGYNVTQVVMGTHSGTHLDVPLHMLDRGKSLDLIDLEKCVGDALVIDLSNKKAKEEIIIDDFRHYEKKILKGSRILLRTDWSRRFGTDSFFSDFPVITKETARWLADRNIYLLGLETPSVHPVEFKSVHKWLLEKDIVIIESLNNLRKLSKEKIFFVAVPLKFKGLDGSPVRAFAIEG